VRLWDARGAETRRILQAQRLTTTPAYPPEVGCAALTTSIVAILKRHLESITAYHTLAERRRGILRQPEMHFLPRAFFCTSVAATKHAA
jgi:hypothetical protein